MVIKQNRTFTLNLDDREMEALDKALRTLRVMLDIETSQRVRPNGMPILDLVEFARGNQGQVEFLDYAIGKIRDR